MYCMYVCMYACCRISTSALLPSEDGAGAAQVRPGRCGGVRESTECLYLLAATAGDQCTGHLHQGSGRFFL